MKAALTFADLDEGDRWVLRRAARLEWAEECAKQKDVLGWGAALFPDKFTLEFCPDFHGYLVQIRRELLTGTEGPRNHAKTNIDCFLIPIFQGLVEPEDFRHYLNVQSTGKKSDAINISIRHEIEGNDLLKEIYGDQIGKGKWTDSEFVLKNGVCFSAIGAGQSIRGIQSDNKRPDFINVDDLFDREHINNLEATQKMCEWFWGDLYPARDKAWPACVHVTGTAINNYDLLEKMKKMKDVVFKSFKAMDEKSDWVLWPELNSREQLERDRINMGSLIFAREMQNERRDETTAIIKRSWLYPTDGSPDWEYDPSELKFGKDLILISVLLLCDPSIGEKVQNDYTGCGIIYQARYADAKEGDGDHWFIHAVYNEHLSLDKRIKLLQNIATEQPSERKVTQCRIESIAGFKDFTEEVRRRTNLPVKEIDHVKDKISNLENKSHFFENRKIKLNRLIDPKLKDQLVYQLTTNYPQHDDLRDMTLLALDANPGSWSFVG